MNTNIDFIPFIDDTNDYNDPSIITEIENEILAELNNTDLQSLHPFINSNYASIGHNNDVLPLSDEGIKPFLEKNISDKYNSDDENNLNLLLIYSLFKNRKLGILLENFENTSIVNNLVFLELNSLKSIDESLSQNLESKKRKLNDIKIQRKRNCLEFKPINNFLINRWNEKIDEFVDVGIELLKTKL